MRTLPLSWNSSCGPVSPNWLATNTCRRTRLIVSLSLWLKELNLFLQHDSKNCLFQYDSKNWTFFLNMSQRMKLSFLFDLRIEPFFLKNVTFKNWTFWNYDSKNWYFFQYDSQIWTFFFFLKKWLTELNFFSKNHSKNWSFLNMTHKIWAFFLKAKILKKNTIQRIELSFDMTQWIEPILQHDTKNWTFFFEYDTKNWTFFEHDSKNWTSFSDLTLRIELFFLIWLKELNLSF